tara:strand:+ start:2663 stop:4876 length:2214 start_codon:yes stop_codon:yes gene_type:complete
MAWDSDNSFVENMANLTTPGDGYSYSGGTLQDESGNAVDTSQNVGTWYGTLGQANDTNTGNSGDDNQGPSSTAATASTTEGYTIAGVVGKILDPTGMFKKGLMYLTGIAEDDAAIAEKMKNGKPIYAKQGDGGGNYAINFLGLPYDVQEATVNGVVGYYDKLSLKVDPKTGKILTDQDGGGMTGYAWRLDETSSSGDNDTNAQLVALQEANTAETAEEPTVSDKVLQWAKDAGIDQAGMEAILADPEKYLTDRGLTLEDISRTEVAQLKADSEADGLMIDGTAAKFAMDKNGVDAQLSQIAEADMSTVDAVAASTADTYTAETNSEKMADGSFDMTAATGTIDDDNLVDASTIETDLAATATGVNADGTVNDVGVAINDFATQKFSSIIDTSTVSGKNLAKALGEGNYVDEKATIAGQMKIISEQFVNAQGQSVIPKWAQKMARSVSATMAFDGITGSAQTSAMATAIMEATLGIAEKEATFFQTLTTKNLDNKQQAIINKANILSNFEVANLGARQAAAVQNAQSFMQMDLKNLTNEQQSALINKQERTQALFEDSKILNAQRLFTADQNNDFKKFYDELTVSIQKHNTAEMNALRRFNTGEANDMSSANAELQSSREKFYQEMQYNIDTSNAKWRQEITTKGFDTTWDAISTDVKNKLDITTEVQNQIWDSTELLLDWIGKSTTSEMNAEVALLTAQMTSQSQQSSGGGFLGGIMKIAGTVAGLSSKPWWMGGTA